MWHSICGTIHHMNVFYGTHLLNDNIARCSFFFFFIFSKFRISGWSEGWKSKKMVINDKKFCLPCLFRNHVLCIKILIFGGHLGGKRAKKMAQNDKKICLTPYLRNHTSFDWFWYTCVKWCLQQFFLFVMELIQINI